MTGQSMASEMTFTDAADGKPSRAFALAHVLGRIDEVVGELENLRTERLREDTQAVRIKLAVAHARKKLSRR